MNWLGLDVGGANLKLADGRGWAISRPFPLWRQPAGLAVAIAELLAEAPRAAGLAVTMTGELADCFATKREGVHAILDAVEIAAASRGFSQEAVRVYLTSGELVMPAAAREQPLRAAAANWHALARFAGRFAPHGLAVLVDIGSTTSDIIPLRGGVPVPRGLTDPERLAAGELVYTGVQRTPICALISGVSWRGARCGVAQELFATTWDVYLMLGELPEEPQNVATADGRPATKACAQDRLARMICADRELFDEQDAMGMSRAVRDAQLDLLELCMKRVLRQVAGTCAEDCPSARRSPKRAEGETGLALIVAGRGEFLARQLAARLDRACLMLSLAELLGPGASHCAPAHALAVLAAEEQQS